MRKQKPDKNRVFTVNLNHDGYFTLKPFDYLGGDIKQITDVRFEVKHLVHNPLRRLYYCKVGTLLRLGIKEIKNDDDVEAFLTVGYETKWVVDMYAEHLDDDAFDVRDFAEANNVDLGNESSDAYCSSDEEDYGDVEVVTTKDPFLLKLCSNSGHYKGFIDEQVNEPTKEVINDSDNIDPKYRAKAGIIYPRHDPSKQWDKMEPVLGMRFETNEQLKLALANYGVANGYQLWFMRNDWKQLLVYCGRDVQSGRCAGAPTIKKRKQDRNKKNGEGSSKDGEGFSTIVMKADIRARYHLNVSIGQCLRAKQRALFDYEGGLKEHYARIWEYRNAVLDTNPGICNQVDVLELPLLKKENKIGIKRMVRVVQKMGRVVLQLWWVVQNGEGTSKSPNKVIKKGRLKRKSVRVVDKKGKNVCGFRLFASWMSTEMSFQIKSLKLKHRCSRNYNLGSLVTYKWIAHHYAKELLADPFIPLLKMKADIRARYHLNVSIGQCLRAKQRALFDYEGGLKEHYARIWEYRNAVLDTNPGIGMLYLVDFKNWKMWELSGIPCIHAVAAYAHLGRNPEEGVHEWYSQERWFQAYQFLIRPVYGSTMWKRTRDPPLLPPLMRRMPGRPKKKRIIAPSENNTQVSRREVVVEDQGGPEGVEGVKEVLEEGKEVVEEGREFMDEDEIRRNFEHDYMEELLIQEEQRLAAEENNQQDEFDEEALRLTIEAEERWKAEDLERELAKKKEEEYWDIQKGLHSSCYINDEEAYEQETYNKDVASVNAVLETQESVAVPQVADVVVPQVADVAAEPNKRGTKRQAADVSFRIYHKNRGRSERIFDQKMKKACFGPDGEGSTPDSALSVDEP
ncbi:hypothetical protein CTI12_AA112880 [Artemisia annua]|uniref:Zinc finger PMZ-type domain-containing protein n=1 Tax=Artemisia annua TaxID=35608 RepID=A0A2U1N028_ARTAN|nr:hypothetical protein CTI12_AA112880 [Artemisia annua]